MKKKILIFILVIQSITMMFLGLKLYENKKKFSKASSSNLQNYEYFCLKSFDSQNEERTSYLKYSFTVDNLGTIIFSNSSIVYKYHNLESYINAKNSSIDSENYSLVYDDENLTVNLIISEENIYINEWYKSVKSELNSMGFVCQYNK